METVPSEVGKGEDEGYTWSQKSVQQILQYSRRYEGELEVERTNVKEESPHHLRHLVDAS